MIVAALALLVLTTMFAQTLASDECEQVDEEKEPHLQLLANLSSPSDYHDLD